MIKLGNTFDINTEDDDESIGWWWSRNEKWFNGFVDDEHQLLPPVS